MQFFLLKHGESRLIEIKEADKDGAEDGEGEKTVELDVPDMEQNGDAEEEKPDETSAEDAALLDKLVNEVTGDDEERKSDSD